MKIVIQPFVGKVNSFDKVFRFCVLYSRSCSFNIKPFYLAIEEATNTKYQDTFMLWSIRMCAYNSTQEEMNNINI